MGMPRAFIGIGSNIDPEENIRKAIRLLGNQLHITGVSTFYRTEPIVRPEQHPFINGVIEVETDIPPLALKMSVLRDIENQLGRVRTDDKYAARTIDLDLLLYDSVVMRTDDLTIPDPDITERPFLAISLHELDADLILPGRQREIARITRDLGAEGIEPLADYTESLRRDLHDEP